MSKQFLENADFNGDVTLSKGVIKPGHALVLKGSNLVSPEGYEQHVIYIGSPEYPAKGDGVTDDTKAIQDALTAAGAAVGSGDGKIKGGKVVFPRGAFLVKKTLTVPGNVHIVGCEPVAGYVGDAASANLPDRSTCRIQVGAGFAGTTLLDMTGDEWSIQNITLWGSRRAGTGINGITMHRAGNETIPTMRGVSIIEFSGDGIRGGALAGRLLDSYVAANKGWGWNMTDSVTDFKTVNCYFNANRLGGVNIDAVTKACSSLEFTNCRFERSGWTTDKVAGVPANPTTVGSPGVRLVTGRYIQFVGCSTDANSGNGVEVVRTAATPDKVSVSNVGFVGCHFNRDGFGDMTALANYAGFKSHGDAGKPPEYVSLVGCMFTGGKADDNGGHPTYQHPKYGVWLDGDSWRYQIRETFIDETSLTTPVNLSGNAGELSLDLPRQRNFTIPAVHAEADVKDPVNGSLIVHRQSGVGEDLKFYYGGSWHKVGGGGGGAPAAAADVVEKYIKDPKADGYKATGKQDIFGKLALTAGVWQMEATIFYNPVSGATAATPLVWCAEGTNVQNTGDQRSTVQWIYTTPAAGAAGIVNTNVLVGTSPANDTTFNTAAWEHGSDSGNIPFHSIKMSGMIRMSADGTFFPTVTIPGNHNHLNLYGHIRLTKAP